MKDKIKELAKFICQESLDLQKGEKVLISAGSIEAKELIEALVIEASAMETFVYTKIDDLRLESLKKRTMSIEVLDDLREFEEYKVNFFDAFIYIHYEENDYELKTLDKTKNDKINQALSHSIDVRANEKKWVILKYPSMLDAYKNQMSYKEYYQYAMEAMTIDYKKLYENIKPLKKLMEQTNNVRIVSPNTDISFSVKGMTAIPCVGEKNIPDGEIYTAPVKESVEGTITYNTPSPYHGNVYHHVSLTFSKGKIIKATSDEEKDLLQTIFAVDEGARYVGEFSFGLNPRITKPMGNILYDEKIFGSIHFTPGAAYEECDNGNRSAVHWDLVLIQTEEYGGGEIYFDDVLIRKDGLFVLETLQNLNKS